MLNLFRIIQSLKAMFFELVLRKDGKEYMYELLEGATPTYLWHRRVAFVSFIEKVMLEQEAKCRGARKECSGPKLSYKYNTYTRIDSEFKITFYLTH